MEFKNSKTAENLMKAFAGESQARNRYTYYASKAKKEGGVGASPKWNFTKYLIDREGNVVNYFLPVTKPTASRVKRAIKKLL